MSFHLEYPLCMFFEQLHWAWKNWSLRPFEEENEWEEIVTLLGEEITNYFEEKRPLEDGL